MANINRQWKRALLLGCSHGHYADPEALKTVLKFKSIYKPHRTFHLGDFVDMAAFRSGAHGTNDEFMSIESDLTHGLNFLKELRPTDLLNGNHEIRLWKLAEHHNAIISTAAGRIINDIKDLAVRMKTNYVEHYDVNRSWIQLADTKMMHGWWFSEQAIRDHAESHGKCVIAHLHRTGSAQGRRSDHPTAYCVGTLANIPALTYANTRRATLAWNHGFCWGEFSDEECVLNISSAQPNQEGGWHLPV